jgi:hypothetical protein
MSYGAAILASDRTAVPFTCGDAAIHFDAYKQEDLLSKLETLLANDTKLIQMREESLDIVNNAL